MGLFDIFSKEKRETRARASHLQRVVSKFAQSGDRYRSMEALAQDGSEEATLGLLRRFGMMYDKSIEDEQEKEWVFDTLAAKGASVLPAVKRYLEIADSVSWPLRLLQKMANTKDEEIDAVAAILARHEPGYERDPTKKMQLIRHVGLSKHARATGLILPYLEDMDEGVRYATVEALLTLKDEAASKDRLLALFISDTEESLRLRIRVADGFAELGWPLGEAQAQVRAKLPEGFQIDRQSHIVKVKKPE